MSLKFQVNFIGTLDTFSTEQIPIGAYLKQKAPDQIDPGLKIYRRRLISSKNNRLKHLIYYFSR